jgi:hypothetical protein
MDVLTSGEVTDEPNDDFNTRISKTFGVSLFPECHQSCTIIIFRFLRVN